MIDAVHILLQDLLNLAVTSTVQDFACLEGDEALELFPVGSFDFVLVSHQKRNDQVNLVSHFSSC